MREWWWKARQREADLDEEIEHDLRLEAELRRKTGLGRADAEEVSRADFGDIDQIKAATRKAWAPTTDSAGRKGLGQRLGGQALYDVRHALRRFVRTPTFTLTALGVLALGIAANVTVFSIANAVLLRPLAFPNPERVVIFETMSPTGADAGASPAMYNHWREQTIVVQDVAAFQQNTDLIETTGTTTVQLQAKRVSAEFFRLYGATAARGRTFSNQEDEPGGEPVVVLSHGLWMDRFGGADVIGRTMTLNGASYTIVGALDAAFRLDRALFGPTPDVWLPLQIDPRSKTLGHSFRVCGQLRPGVTLTRAQAELGLSTESFRRDFPTALSKTNVFTVEPVREALLGNTRPLFVALLGSVVFVLLIACSNIANLLLLQGANRRREIALRAAIGASRRRLVRQLLTEHLLLSCSGGAAGLALGWMVVRLLLSNVLSSLAEISLDWRVIAFTVTVSVATGVLFGLAPALRVSRVDLAATISADAHSNRGPSRRRVESILVVLQVTLALVLLVGSALFMRTVSALTHVDAGFDPDHVLTMQASLSGPEFAATRQVDGIVQRGLAALRAEPGVATAAASYGLPLQGGGGLPFEIVGRPLPAGQTFHGGAAWAVASPDYFKSFRIPVLQGREFTADDGQGRVPVMVINDVMARRYWPHESPIGQHVIAGHGVGPQFQDEPVREIVGVVKGIRENRLDHEPGAEMYEPLAQLPDAANAWMAPSGLAWIVRTDVAPDSLARALPQVLQYATGRPVSHVRPMDEIVLQSVLRQRVSMWLMAGFGTAALLLASIGLYGLIAYSVEQRTREIGIRLALGADASRVRWLVIWQGMRLAVVGAGFGIVAALILSRLVAGLLFNVQARDPTTLAIVTLVAVSVAGFAVWLPARRASRVDPMVALRYE